MTLRGNDSLSSIDSQVKRLGWTETVRLIDTERERDGEIGFGDVAPPPEFTRRLAFWAEVSHPTSTPPTFRSVVIHRIFSACWLPRATSLIKREEKGCLGIFSRRPTALSHKAHTYIIRIHHIGTQTHSSYKNIDITRQAGKKQSRPSEISSPARVPLSPPPLPLPPPPPHATTRIET